MCVYDFTYDFLQVPYNITISLIINHHPIREYYNYCCYYKYECDEYNRIQNASSRSSCTRYSSTSSIQPTTKDLSGRQKIAKRRVKCWRKEICVSAISKVGRRCCTTFKKEVISFRGLVKLFWEVSQKHLHNNKRLLPI